MDQNSSSLNNIKSEFSLLPDGNYNIYENPNIHVYQNYGSPNELNEPEAKRRALMYPFLESALSPSQPPLSWPTTNASISSTPAATQNETDDQRFTAKRKQEIQHLIDQGQVLFEPANEKGFNKVIHNHVPLGLQCVMCFALFSTRTRTYLKAHLEKCMVMTKNQAPYPLSAHEIRMLNLYMAELMAMDSRFSFIAETETFQALISYIKELGFNVGRKCTNFSAPVDILPSPLNVKNSVASEVHHLVHKFKDFFSKHPKFEYIVVLDHESLKHAYMGIIIRFVHDWQLKYVVLNVQDTVKINLNKIDHLKSVLHNFNLQISHHFVTSDKDPNLSNGLINVGLSSCISQILKTVITQSTLPKNGIEEEEINFDKIDLPTLTVFQSIFVKMENVVDRICNKPNLSGLQSLHVFFDRRHKWISRVEMVESWLKITEADKGHLLMNFGGENEIINQINDISSNQDHLDAFITVLKPFQDRLQFLQSDYSPTINHVLICLYELEDYLNHLKNSENVLVKALITSTITLLFNMKVHFTQPIHYATCTMDIFQRAKIRQLRNVSEVKIAKEETEKLFVDYIKRNTPAKNKSDINLPIIDDYAMCLDDELESNDNSVIFAAKNELAQYYRYIPSADLITQKDVLLFWKSVAAQFPQLSKFASYILSIPATSNFIDKMCSTSTKIAAKEKSLDASMLSDLMLCKSLKDFNFV